MLVPTIRAASNVKSCFGQEQQQHFITTFYKKNVKIQVSPKNRIANPVGKFPQIYKIFDNTKGRSDPRTYLANLVIISYRHLNNSGGFNGIRTHDLSDASIMLYQPNYKANQLDEQVNGP